MARLSERDAREWQAIAGRVGDVVEPRLGPRVLANRASLPLGPALRRARSAARRLSARAEAVLRTDVRAFYASVTPSIAFRSLTDLGVDAPVASRTATMMDGWGSEGYVGLPIGPPGSAVIANAILAPLDRELRPSPFLRWVDDYVIAVRERDVHLVTERVDASLARMGLERSIPKTEVLGGGSSLVWPGTYLRDDLADR
jgi:Reverse transcriptase (RNA-dependent DNA polymerase)